MGYDGGRIAAEGPAAVAPVAPSQHVPRIRKAHATHMHIPLERPGRNVPTGGLEADRGTATEAAAGPPGERRAQPEASTEAAMPRPAPIPSRLPAPTAAAHAPAARSAAP